MEQEKERYSFSKLSAFRTCKYAYDLTYLQHKKGIGNCFSSYGTEVHSLLERYAKGELTLEILPLLYEWEFEGAVPEPFPNSPFCKDMRGNYYRQGLEFLKAFKGYDEYDILGVETKFDLTIEDWTFNGIIDLVLKDKRGGIILQDYKSKKKFKNKTEQKEYARQLYLYSKYIQKAYGESPRTLRFYMFRTNATIDIPFTQTSLLEAEHWATDTVNKIRSCWDFEPTQNEFYCNNLCNHRKYCRAKNG